MVTRSRFDTAPQQEELDLTDHRWRKWFQDVWSSINAVALPLPSAITVTASPFVTQFNDGGQGSIIVSGGTVTLIEWSRDGTTYYPVGTTGGMLSVSQGDRIRVTYTVAPTITKVLR